MQIFFINAKMQLNEFFCYLIGYSVLCFQKMIELFLSKDSALHLVQAHVYSHLFTHLAKINCINKFRNLMTDFLKHLDGTICQSSQ